MVTDPHRPFPVLWLQLKPNDTVTWSTETWRSCFQRQTDAMDLDMSDTGERVLWLLVNKRPAGAQTQSFGLPS